MNFPGLDPTWAGVHRGLHDIGMLITWTMKDTRRNLKHGCGVLVVASTALGDSLLTTPLISSLSDRLGPKRVGLLVRQNCAELYQGDPRISRVFSVKGKHRGCLSLAKELRKSNFKIALMANFTEPDLVPWLWWGGVRGFLRYRSRWTRFPEWMANQSDLRKPADPDYATGHAIENNLAMAQALDIDATSHELLLPHLRTEQSTLNIGPAQALQPPYVIIHPGASRPNKRWPADRWAGLADRLMQEKVSLGFTGSPGEVSLVEEIMAKMTGEPKNIVNLAGKLSLVELAQVQRNALLFISGDTGPYHLAVAVGCPTFTLFAPTDRGSSMEACGPHQANPYWHRAISTASFASSIESLTLEHVIQEAFHLLWSCLIEGKERRV